MRSAKENIYNVKPALSRPPPGESVSLITPGLDMSSRLMHFEMSRIGGSGSIQIRPLKPKPKKSQGFRVDFHRDPQTGMLPRCGLGSARCVQKFDDSLNLQFTLRFALSLRSSSMRKPRDPLLKVVFNYLSTTLYHIHKVRSLCVCVCVLTP